MLLNKALFRNADYVFYLRICLLFQYKLQYCHLQRPAVWEGLKSATLEWKEAPRALRLPPHSHGQLSHALHPLATFDDIIINLKSIHTHQCISVLATSAQVNVALNQFPKHPPLPSFPLLFLCFKKLQSSKDLSIFCLSTHTLGIL